MDLRRVFPVIKFAPPVLKGYPMRYVKTLGEVPPTDEEKSYFSSQVDNFKKKAAEFYATFTRLIALGPRVTVINDPSLSAEYKTLTERGGTIRATIESVTAKIQSAIDWFKNLGGNVLIDAYGESIPDGGLGFLPLAALIPLSVIAGALAVMAKYVSDVYLFNRKLEEVERLRLQGLSTSESLSIVTSDVSPGFGLPTVGNIGKLLLTGAGVFVLYKVLTGLRREH